MHDMHYAHLITCIQFYFVYFLQHGMFSQSVLCVTIVSFTFDRCFALLWVIAIFFTTTYILQREIHFSYRSCYVTSFYYRISTIILHTKLIIFHISRAFFPIFLPPLSSIFPMSGCSRPFANPLCLFYFLG